MTASPRAPLICFDLGRVLVRICDGWADGFEAAGLPGAPPDLRDPGQRDALTAAVHAFELGACSVADFAAACTRLLSVPTEVVHRVVDAWVRGATPGATALLDELRARGLRTACLSNTNARHWELMSTWKHDADQLWPRLELRYASHELGLRKPDPAIYAALEKHSGFAATDIVFFDDLADNIAAARARGWRAVQVRTPDPVAEMRAWLARAGLL